MYKFLQKSVVLVLIATIFFTSFASTEEDAIINSKKDPIVEISKHQNSVPKDSIENQKPTSQKSTTEKTVAELPNQDNTKNSQQSISKDEKSKIDSVEIKNQENSISENKQYAELPKLPPINEVKIVAPNILPPEYNLTSPVDYTLKFSDFKNTTLPDNHDGIPKSVSDVSTQTDSKNNNLNEFLNAIFHLQNEKPDIFDEKSAIFDKKSTNIFEQVDELLGPVMSFNHQNDESIMSNAIDSIMNSNGENFFSGMNEKLGPTYEMEMTLETQISQPEYDESPLSNLFSQMSKLGPSHFQNSRSTLFDLLMPNFGVSFVDNVPNNDDDLQITKTEYYINDEPVDLSSDKFIDLSNDIEYTNNIDIYNSTAQEGNYFDSNSDIDNSIINWNSDMTHHPLSGLFGQLQNVFQPNQNNYEEEKMSIVPVQRTLNVNSMNPFAQWLSLIGNNNQRQLDFENDFGNPDNDENLVVFIPLETNSSKSAFTDQENEGSVMSNLINTAKIEGMGENLDKSQGSEDEIINSKKQNLEAENPKNQGWIYNPLNLLYKWLPTKHENGNQNIKSAHESEN